MLRRDGSSVELWGRIERYREQLSMCSSVTLPEIHRERQTAMHTRTLWLDSSTRAPSPLALLLAPRIARLARSQHNMAPRKARQARKTPTTSPAVSLPTETLARILELVVEDLEDSEPFTAQLYRLRFAKVCRHWCTVALPLDVYVVGSSQRAQKLAKVLEARPVGERPTSLDITVEPTGSKSARAGRVAALLRACPRLTTLRLDVSATLGVKRYDDLGEPVRAALMTLRHLVSLELFGCALAARHSWSALCVESLARRTPFAAPADLPLFADLHPGRSCRLSGFRNVSGTALAGTGPPHSSPRSKNSLSVSATRCPATFSRQCRRPRRTPSTLFTSTE